jgi:hypothetical protein
MSPIEKINNCPQITQRGKADCLRAYTHRQATKKEISRRGAKDAERQSDLYRLATLCALSVFAKDKKP